MPQKTKKDKQIADLRRRLNKQSASVSNNNYSFKNIPTLTETVKREERPSFSTPTQNSVKDLPSQILAIDPHYYTRDLRKTFILTAVVVIAELLLYWVLEIKGVRF